MILILLACVASLGIVLFFATRPSQLLRIAAPMAPAPTANISNLKDTAITNGVVTVTTSTVLEKPRYTGQDNLGRNWLLTAATAGQQGNATSGTYVLNQVQATFNNPSATTTGSQGFIMSADTGHYQQASSQLKLTGAVSATGLGFNLTAPVVDADLETRKLQATGGSRVTGRAGNWDVNITAPTLDADQNTNSLLLTGGVHAIFTPTKAR